LATLLQAFRDELEWVTMSGNIQNVRSSATRAIVGLAEGRVGAGEFANEVLKDLIEALNNYGPDDLYFGAHMGDGACFGWWKAVDA
jgi:glutamate racemase